MRLGVDFEKQEPGIVNPKCKTGLQRFVPPWQCKLYRRCRVCEANGAEQHNICKLCTEQFQEAAGLCPICAEAIPENATECSACSIQTPAFCRTTAAWLWSRPIEQLIKQFKFDFRRDVGHDIAALFAEQIARQPLSLKPDVLVPMPLHRSRLKERGFNQAAILAESLSRATRTPVLHAASRVRATAAQSGLNRQQRLKNLKGAFVSSPAVKDLNVAIVDDVMTTGSSAQMLSLALLAAGAKSVQVIVACKVL